MEANYKARALIKALETDNHQKVAISIAGYQFFCRHMAENLAPTHITTLDFLSSTLVTCHSMNQSMPT